MRPYVMPGAQARHSIKWTVCRNNRVDKRTRESPASPYASSFNAVSVLMRVAASMSLRASDSSGW